MPYTVTLSSDYSRQSFIDSILKPIFQNRVLEFNLYDTDTIEYYELTESEKEVASAVIKYGEMQTCDNKTIELFDVVLRDNVRIERNKIKVGSLVKNKIMTTHALFANFSYETPDQKEWRFSFIAYDSFFEAGDIVTQEINPKRFTYLLGNGNSCRTASNRFDSLTANDDITLALIKEAFSVENVSDDFFNEYRNHYGNFVEFLTGKRIERIKGKWTEVKKCDPSPLLNSTFKGDEKKARDFCKKTLGRIVFLYFLQKKGWLGASSQDYTDGDPNFLQNFFNQTEKSDGFYPNHLSTLFFDTLNSERANDEFVMPNGSSVKIPFLNGGLFDLEKEEYRFITFPPALFEDLFEFFNRYNFTVYEDSSEDHTVAVDPEMLGHIFENLLEDNKDKGAFYTPRPIVEYMCQESLVQYLLTHCENGGIAGADDKDALLKALELFIKNKDASSLNGYEQILATALRNVKICDPAIGSGAFPMGILHEIFTAANVLHEISPGTINTVWGIDDPELWKPAQIKEHIIQNSIYGVDIEKGAVDIARLRFWLSLVVDEDTPRALPNLDYKIMQGNSLLESYHDIDLDVSKLEKQATQLFADPNAFTQNDVDQLKQLVKQYFHPEDSTDKYAIKTEIENIVRKFIDDRVGALQEQWTKKFAACTENLAAANKTPTNTNALVKKKEQAIKKYTKELATIQKKLEEVDQQVAQIHTMFREKEYNFFLWHLWFFEVFENGGFDIVIGNPPYGLILQKSEKDIVKDIFVVHQGPFDSYKFFIEKGMQLLKNSGSLCYITPNTWINLSYFKKLRLLISSEYKLILCSQTLYNVFTEVVVDTNIYIIKKERVEDQKYKIISEALNYVGENIIDDKENPLIVLKNKPPLIKKIDKVDKTLDDFIDVWRGMSAYGAANPDKPFNSDTKETEFHRKLLNGGNIGKYSIEWGGEYIKYGDWLHRPRPVYIYDEPHLLVQRIRNPKLNTRLVATFDDNKYISSDGLSNLIIKDKTQFDVLLVLLGILNSSLINYWFSFYFFDVNIKPEQLRLIPIKLPECSSKIISHVNQVLQDKENNKDTTALEQEIDTMVFKLYELSYEEVLVVEPEYWLSKDEYDNFRIMNH